MSTGDVFKLFWPSHICSPKTRTGFLVGWHTSGSTACVAAVIPDVELDDLKCLLSEFCVSGNNPEFAHINNVCKASPKLLGAIVPSDAPVSTISIRSKVDEEYGLWLSVMLDEAYVPIPISMVIRGSDHVFLNYQIIFYEQPNPRQLQFLALEPLELDITSKEPVAHEPSETKANLEKILKYSHILSGHQQYPLVDDLTSVLVQINSSYYLENGVKSVCAQRRRLKKGWFWRMRRIWSGLQKIIQSMVQILVWSPVVVIKKIILFPLICLVFALLAITEFTIHLLNMRLPKFFLNAVAIKDLSAAGQQVDLRLQQLYFWPRQYMKLRKHNWANTAATRAYYISFYNSMWLVANDIIIGLAIGSFLVNNHHTVARFLHQVLYEYTVASLKSMMLWFLESPAGLKLNHELGSFLSELFLWLIWVWTNCMKILEPSTPQIIRFIGFSGICGVSMVISLMSDLLAFMTLHVYCFYMVAAKIFNWQLTTLYSLFNLFRGKKRNMLRNRIDSCDYALDQLLLGTCLFTLLTFLFPTILIYYMTFALGRVGVIFLQAIMETLLAFFNHFPLFAIMLRIKDADRLPGGLQFDIFHHEDFVFKYHPMYRRLRWLQRLWDGHGTSSDTHSIRPHRRKTVRFKLPQSSKKEATPSPPKQKGAYLWMRNTPIPFSAIFFQYMLLWKRLSAHYFSAYVFKCLLYGEPIKPIPKLQVSLKLKKFHNGSICR
ncbi:N-acetylglucosaminyl transferase component-domain-containing protein [Radiomyces spectabilis]|uniref:N-acetylglucosaminyl transferase component-domain-containing protein n=1 Tax=Radiomyces spectabilis TaxID=64574 RepID=UPI00221E7555|nr:N-acetylglucosaminyl transferase component-domain-containing protein [Radiomyces spectabilis]KAI8374740.1 N-acetylglucosaminyl transferase component-domain-containing protein [Radiomyces spectabilis]